MYFLRRFCNRGKLQEALIEYQQKYEEVEAAEEEGEPDSEKVS